MTTLRIATIRIVALFFIVTGFPVIAWAAPYAALVMDARSGEVLHARSADRRLHPASLTKMMTLYLTFEAIRDGKVRLDQKVKISRHASRQVPSKLGLRQGKTVTIKDLVRATAVKSANDAAVALAEALAGSEKEFAKRMTTRARELGMKNTTFANASGLTHSRQRSTARDMAILGRSLFYDFPQYYNLFGRKKTYAAGRAIYATNRRLLNSYRGADGIKTGYTAAAGYNLVSSAKRGEKRIIAVVFGGRSGRWRNARIAELLDMGFKRAPRYAAVKRWPNVAVTKSPPPRKRPETLMASHGRDAPQTVIATTPQTATVKTTQEGGTVIEIADAPEPAPILTTVRESEMVRRDDNATEFAPLKTVAPRKRPGSQVATQPTNVGPVPRKRPTKTAQSTPAPAWSVQLGVFRNEDTAVAELAAVALSDISGLEAAGRTVEETRLAGVTAWRARLTGFDKSGANTACAAIRTRGKDCLPVAPRPAIR
ncbi:MAG: serine hydrolase [Pikeienuella sp.]